MPMTHTRTFRVRYYECDREGYLDSANYFRYMQEAAFDATAAAGYDKDRYEAMGHIWLARETQIEYFAPIPYNATVEIKTWVDSFRRVRSWRAYEFRLAGAETLVARAGTDWVYLDVAAQRPGIIPPELSEAFWPGEEVTISPRRESFPESPPPPTGVFTSRRYPEWRDIDTAQHVNNAAYLDYITDLGRQAVAHFGWSHEHLAETGIDFVPHQQRIEYLQPALLEDELELATWISDVNATSCIRHYTISRVEDGALLTRIRALWHFIDPATNQETAISPDFWTDLAAHIANGK